MRTLNFADIKFDTLVHNRRMYQYAKFDVCEVKGSQDIEWIELSNIQFVS
jgi:hypothetical protein